MDYRLVNDRGEKTYVLVFETGDEVMAGLRDFAARQMLDASAFTAIGAFQDAVLAYFDWERREYRKIPVPEQVEVLTLAGDIALEEGQPKVHAHVVVGLPDGATRGGHLMEAHVRPTLEVVLREAPSGLRRTYDPEAGLALIDLSRTPVRSGAEEIP